jgi:hypothetical protein
MGDTPPSPRQVPKSAGQQAAYHPLRLVDGLLAALPAPDEPLLWVSHCRATSAASSLALCRFLPSYQKRAACWAP